MTNEGAYNLLIAIMKLAYQDYKTGLKYMKKGVQMSGRMLHDYKTAKEYLSGYNLGEYLKNKAKEELDEIQ